MTNNSYEVNPMRDTGDYISLETYLKLLSYPMPDEVRMLITILWKSGRRDSEILGGRMVRKNREGNIYYVECDGLRPMDIDWTNKLITFCILKKKVEGIVKKPKPVDDAFLADLKAYISVHKVGERDKIIPRSRQWFDLKLKRLTAESGITTISGRRLHAHCFRHSWNAQAARLAKSPEDIALQKSYMEHSTENITMSYYMNFGQSRIRKLIERMGEE
jgi:hypothetical protein